MDMRCQLIRGPIFEGISTAIVGLLLHKDRIFNRSVELYLSKDEFLGYMKEEGGARKRDSKKGF